MRSVRDDPMRAASWVSTMTLHFTKGSAEAPLTMMSPLMRHVIWCDMHPDVKGNCSSSSVGAENQEVSSAERR